MPSPALFDTNVLVDCLRGKPKAVELVRRNAERIVLSPIVIAELYAGVKDGAEREALDEFVSLFHIAAVDAEIGRRGGLIKREYGPSHGIGLADAIIAATAMELHAELFTLNVKHFPMMKGRKSAYRS